MQSSEQNKKRLGVIGGVGPAASSFFYSGLVRHTRAACDQDHLDIILLSHASLPDRTAVIESGDDAEFLRLIREDVQALERLGAANIAIPCNTSHYFYDQIQQMTAVPIIHMVRESVTYAAAHFHPLRKIGIMGTDGTVRTGIYDRECQGAGVAAVYPSPEMQKKVMTVIYDEIKRGGRGSEALFAAVYGELKNRGCDAVILACTELSVYKQYHRVPEDCLDAMDVLIRESIVRSGAEYIENPDGQ